MKGAHSLTKLVLDLALLGGLALVFVFAIRLTRRTPGPSVQASIEYPPPHASQAINPTPTGDSGKPEPTPILDPAEATQIASKLNYTPSPSDIAAEETYIAEMATYNAQSILITHSPPPTPVYYPVKSIADLPKVVLNDPFFGNVNNGDFGACVKADQPGEASFVKSLDYGEGYYVVPFFEDEKVCGVFLVTVQNGLGTAAAGGQGRGEKYPALDAEEAKALIEKKTGQKVWGEPLLAFGNILEVPDPFCPFWVVSTADGQTYYVLGIVGVRDVGWSTEELITYIWNVTEVHPRIHKP